MHGNWLRELSDMFSLAWASAWGFPAHSLFGPILNLREFPLRPFACDPVPARGESSWRWVRGSPLAAPFSRPWTEPSSCSHVSIQASRMPCVAGTRTTRQPEASQSPLRLSNRPGRKHRSRFVEARHPRTPHCASISLGGGGVNRRQRALRRTRAAREFTSPLAEWVGLRGPACR